MHRLSRRIVTRFQAPGAFYQTGLRGKVESSLPPEGTDMKLKLAWQDAQLDELFVSASLIEQEEG